MLGRVRRVYKYLLPCDPEGLLHDHPVDHLGARRSGQRAEVVVVAHVGRQHQARPQSEAFQPATCQVHSDTVYSTHTQLCNQTVTCPAHSDSLQHAPARYTVTQFTARTYPVHSLQHAHTTLQPNRHLPGTQLHSLQHAPARRYTITQFTARTCPVHSLQHAHTILQPNRHLPDTQLHSLQHAHTPLQPNRHLPGTQLHSLQHAPARYTVTQFTARTCPVHSDTVYSMYTKPPPARYTVTVYNTHTQHCNQTAPCPVHSLKHTLCN